MGLNHHGKAKIKVNGLENNYCIIQQQQLHPNCKHVDTGELHVCPQFPWGIHIRQSGKSLPIYFTTIT